MESRLVEGIFRLRLDKDPNLEDACFMRFSHEDIPVEEERDLKIEEFPAGTIPLWSSLIYSLGGVRLELSIQSCTKSVHS